MRFDAQQHHRGMHSLANEQDHQVLSRAKLKGLLINPRVIESAGLSSQAQLSPMSTYCPQVRPYRVHSVRR